MKKETAGRIAAVFATGYIKTWLETQYDELMKIPALANLKAADRGTKRFVEALIYGLTAAADLVLPDGPWSSVKSVLMDAGPEIASRFLKDTRPKLESVATTGEEPDRGIARKLLALDDHTLLSTLIRETTDEATRAQFLKFAATASTEELKRLASLSPYERSALLGLDPEKAAKTGVSFFKAAGDVMKSGAKASLPSLLKYLNLLWIVLKASGFLWVGGFMVCAVSTLTGRWGMLAFLLVLLGLGAVASFLGKKSEKVWLAYGGGALTVVLALLAAVVAAGDQDSVIALSILFLVGLPTLLIVALLIPVTGAMELLQAIFPAGHKVLIRSVQMLLAAFFGILFFSAVLLVFPPQKPVAFLFIMLAVITLAMAVGFGLVRINPETFLKTPVLVGMIFLLLVTGGLMSMPNLRYKLRSIPFTLDDPFGYKPFTVSFPSSSDIAFVSPDGKSLIWYAEREGGGFDLFHCEGKGPYYTKDGRELAKADSDKIRRKIAAWVDQDAANKAEAIRKANQDLAEQERILAARQSEERRLLAVRQGEEKRIAEEQLAAQRLAAQQKADEDRRRSYLRTSSLASKVEYIVCAAGAEGEPQDAFSAAIAKHLRGRGKPVTNTVFSPTFVASRAFDSFFEGRGGRDIAAMPISKMGDKILLSRVSNTIKQGTSVQGLYTSAMSVSFMVLSANDGAVIDSFDIATVGPGASESGATSAATENIVAKLMEHSF